MTSPEQKEPTIQSEEKEHQPDITKVIPLGGAATVRVAQGEDWPGKIRRSESRPYFA